jgi:dTMP kinase
MLISFEGTEGCGKSTLIRHLLARFNSAGMPAISTREPGGSPVAEKIRNLILHDEMDPMTELFLYESARAEHFENTIAPALKAKKIILCDRFIDSTVAYQGFARGLKLPVIESLNKIATRGRAPDLTFFLDLPVEQGLARATDPNKFEKAGIEFQKKVRKGFLYSIRKNKKRWRVLKVANRTPDQIADEAMAIILAKLKPAKKTKKKARKK